MVKVDIFSGFLGAGKTTLIRKLIKEAYNGEKIVLIENEFGEIGVDADFLQDAGIQITEMSQGCICCSLVGDFTEALKKVVDEMQPERIVIEPSGVGKLSDVIKAVKATNSAELQLNSFTTVCDAKKIQMYVKNFGEFYNDQVENANCIVLSRSQDLTQEKLDQVVEMLREKNATATIITTKWDNLNGKAIVETMEHRNNLEDELEHLKHETQHHHHHHHHDEDEEHECCCHHEHHHEHDEDEEHECCCHHEHHHDHDEGEEHECCCHHEHAKDKQQCSLEDELNVKDDPYPERFTDTNIVWLDEDDEDEEHECCCHHEHHHEHDEDEEHECCCHHEHYHEHDEDEEHECCCHHDHDEEECDDPNCSCHDHHHHHHDHHHADEVFTSWGKETSHKYSQSEIEDILKKLDDIDTYGLVLRAKGIVENTDGSWIYFDYVPEESNVRTGEAISMGRFCVIGSKLNEKALAELFG